MKLRRRCIPSHVLVIPDVPDPDRHEHVTDSKASFSRVVHSHPDGAPWHYHDEENRPVYKRPGKADS